jgi:hypothetical protein
MKIKDIADAYDVQYVLLPPDIMKTNKYGLFHKQR